jgi:SAM-dependent methyltransferase
MKMPDEHYENPRLAALYDFDSGWSVDRDFYLSLATNHTFPVGILDLGCGTGLLCKAYAEKGHHVTGCDPSLSMLDVAARQPNGDLVKWMQSFAQTFKSDDRYDLIIMTGHAFQVLLQDEEILATFSVMRQHLKEDGLIVFESRNPVINWKENWDYSMSLDLPEGKVQESRLFVEEEKDRMIFELWYQFPDEVLVSKSELRFLSHDAISNFLMISGLRVEKILGDWNGGLFHEPSSEEMIFFVRRVS